MTQAVRELRDLLRALETSDIYETVAPEKSQLRDDLIRLLVLCTGALNSGVPSPSTADNMESAKAALTKNKGTFHAGLSMYPVGVYICSTASNMITQCRQDQVLQNDIETAGEHALSVKINSYLDISKTKDGDLELALPCPAKFFDMIAKYRSFSESASLCLKEQKEDEQKAVEHVLECFHTALFQFVEKKFEAKFLDLEAPVKSLREGTMSPDTAALGLQTMRGIVAYQPTNKQILAKIFGKDAPAVEAVIASVGKVAGLVEKAWPKLVDLNSKTVNEEMLLDASLVSLFASLNDADLMANVGKTVKSWVTPFEGIRNFIRDAVALWLGRATSTFRPFIKMLMGVEFGSDTVKKMLDTGIVGSVDCDADDKETHVQTCHHSQEARGFF